MIKPIEIVQNYPDIKGIVFDIATLPTGKNNGLVGYRIEYLTPNSSSSDAKVNNF
jgi:hypothetical protein